MTTRRRYSIHIRLKTVLPDADRQSQVVKKTREDLVGNIFFSLTKMRKVVRRILRSLLSANWNLR